MDDRRPSIPIFESPALPDIARLAKQHALRLGTLLKLFLVARMYPSETVHQIRVLTRKCTAAWQLLTLSCPDDLPSAELKKLKALRRQLGNLRDADIRIDLFHRFQRGRKTAAAELHGALLNDWHLQFHVTRSFMQAKANRYSRLLQRLQQQADRISRKVRHRRWKKRHLAWLQQKIDAWLPEQEQLHASQLHAFRIATKRLRYLLQSIVPQRKKYAATSWQSLLNSIQDDLGDHLDWCNFQNWLKEFKQSLEHRRETCRPLQQQTESLIKWCDKEILHHTRTITRLYRQVRMILPVQHSQHESASGSL